MEIPRTIEEWLEGGPWVKKGPDFWSPILKKEFPKPFELHTYRESHEIGHCIAATDEEVFQPSWGIEEFVPIHNKLSLKAILKEMEVYVIQIRLSQYMGQLDHVERIKRAMTELTGQCKVFRSGRFWQEQHDAFIKKWSSVEICWQELQRKYNLVRGRI